MRTKHLLEDYIGQKSKVSILRILYRGTELTGREIARKADLSPRAAQQALQELYTTGVVHRKTVGASYLFSLNRSRYLVENILSPLFESEQGLAAAMIEELRKALPNKGIISLIMFGSVARGENKQSSDLDVMIVVENSLDVGKITAGVQDKGGKFLEKFGMMLSPHVIRRRDFISRFDKKDKLIQNVIKEGRVIFGKRFEEVLAHEPKETPH
ncbi:MAG: nucleotidyltransferase domain-containing protein [Elusimicrobiota bacterium]|nr:nucleotidyltransferase domain-containing protein [Elusimicrobiota bacterium]